MKKFNCWEYKKCQRQPGGKHAGDSPCMASVEAKLDGVHGGKNAGRTCWVVSGTLGGNKPIGRFAMLQNDCNVCDFYQKVRSEEPEFKFAISLLNIRRNTIMATH